nr:T9SS type A sorting domain-containing protein [Melioribacteraceae bacterium]
LNWATATEINNYGFEIEKSFDKVNWNKIAFKNGYGNSNSVKDYNYTDNDITKNGMYYYRLKQIDNNGSFEYSNIVEVNVNIPVKFEVAQNFPNPFNPVTNISFTLPEATNVTLYIFNAIGQQIKAINAGYKDAGKHTLEFDGSNLNSGVYFYKVEAGKNSMIRKMALIK